MRENNDYGRHEIRARLRSATVGALCVVVICSLPRVAAANELDEFQQALRAYENQDYALASSLFEALVGGDQARVQNRALRLESRKYLAASYLFVGRPAEAAEQFGKLLSEDSSYQLDPLSFPEDVQKSFADAREKHERERAVIELEKKRAEKEENKKKISETETDRRKMARLITIAQTERVEKRNSRWIGLVPFGAGQFQNGDSAWGTFFAISEGLTGAASIVCYFFHESLRGQNPQDLSEARFAEGAFRYTNQVSLVLLATLVVAGIVDAQLRYKPLESETRIRPLPDDLREFTKPAVKTSDLGLRLRF
jgi:hypothetical protein